MSVSNAIPLSEDPEAVSPIFDFFRPKPSPFRLIRVGGSRDGAYLVPDDLRGVTACFSPGVANRKTFEDELALRFGVRSYLLDFSVDEQDLETPLIAGFQVFEKKWLAPNDSQNSVSLDTWVRQKENSASNLLLQMDIEGSEYSVLASTCANTLRKFRILVIEFHDFQERLGSKAGDHELVSIVRKLDRDFVAVHARANNCCPPEASSSGSIMVPPVMEFTFLRKDRFEELPLKRLRVVKIPHPRDISRNDPSNPPLHLGAEWYESPRPIRAALKVQFDILLWFLQSRFGHWPHKIMQSLVQIIRNAFASSRVLKQNPGGKH